MIDMNLQIESIKSNLINVINNSGLPIGVIHYVLKDISTEVANEYHRILSLEQQQKEQEEHNENKSEEKEL